MTTAVSERPTSTHVRAYIMRRGYLRLMFIQRLSTAAAAEATAVLPYIVGVWVSLGMLL